MAGKGVSCGSQREDMRHHPRVSSRFSNGNSGSYTRASKVIEVDERGSSRLNLQSINSFHRVGTRSIIAHGKRSAGTAKPESSSLSGSPSSSFPNFFLGSKDSAISFSSDLQCPMHCRSASSDESGSDSDEDVVERLASTVPAVKGTASRNNSGYPSASGFVVPFKGDCMERGFVQPTMQRSNGAGMLNWEDYHTPSTSEPRSDLERLNGFATAKPPLSSSLIGFPSPDHRCVDCDARLNKGENGRSSIDHTCSFGAEVGATWGWQRPQRSAVSADSSESLGQLLGCGRGSDYKRKTGTRSILGRRMRPMASQEVGFRESNNTASGLIHRGGPSRRNLSSLSCSSAADVLPSVSNSSAARSSDHIRHKRIVSTPGLNSGGAGLKDTRTGTSRVASGSNGRVWPMVSNKSPGRPSPELNLHRLDRQLARPARRQLSRFHHDTRCTRRLISLGSEPVAPSASTVFGSAQSALSSCTRREADSFVSRSRNNFGVLGRFSEQYLDSDITFREELPSRFQGNSSRVSSGSSTPGNLFDTVAVESVNSSRSTVDSLFSSSAMTQFTTSGPPPTRRPPLPRSGSTLAHTSTSRIAVSPPSFRTSSPCIPHGSRPHRFLPSDDQGSQDASSAESAVYGAFHDLGLHSTGENRARLTVDSLSEILSALEYVERDEELSYEQILMLEATILLGGIGLHDQHRDMRLDVDNMSYEELLALEERMGNVNTGLNEKDISKFVKKIRYTSFERTGDHVPKEVEVKCSICQEEFQDNVELGLLECGHSHHIACINQWLLQKNQCPICKATASL